MVAVLFARHDSIYKTLPDCDVWDAERDARNWPGGCPVIAHPPCRSWGRLRRFAKPLPGERENAIWAVRQVREWGGVLEHPAGSLLWQSAVMPQPGDRDRFGGFTIWISQYWFGHKADKPTWLYICGIEPADLPPLPFVLGEPAYVINTSKRAAQGKRPEVSKAEREHTPLALAEWLRDVALRVASTGAGRAENNRRRSPVSTLGASLVAPQPYAAEGGGSFTAPTGHALSNERKTEMKKMSKQQTAKIEDIKMRARLRQEAEPVVTILDNGNVKIVMADGIEMTLNRKGEYV